MDGGVRDIVLELPRAHGCLNTVAVLQRLKPVYLIRPLSDRVSANGHLHSWQGARNFMAKVRAQSPDNPHLELSLARSFRFGREIASVSDAIIRYGWKLAAGGPTHYGAAAARGAGGPRTKPANLVGTWRAALLPLLALLVALCSVCNRG